MNDRNLILVAEDNRDDMFLLRWAFTRAGLAPEIIHMPDGEATLDYLKGTPPFDDRALHPLPELLLLDIKMPKANGFDVLAWLATRPDLSWLPVVVFSASVFPAEVQRAIELGAREFLTKPSALDELVLLVRRLHDRWLTGNRPGLPPFDFVHPGSSQPSEAACLLGQGTSGLEGRKGNLAAPSDQERLG